MVSGQRNGPAAEGRRPLEDVFRGPVVVYHIHIAGSQGIEWSAEVPGDTKSLQEDLGHYHRRTHIERDTSSPSQPVDAGSEDAEIARREIAPQ